MRDYKQEILKCKDIMVSVDLSQSIMDKINSFADEVIKKKTSEYHYQIDEFHMFKRFQTGMMGECAVEQFLGAKFVDWSVGESKFYNDADLRKIRVNIGVKTVEIKKFHIISKNVVRPEIICVRKENQIILCGIATISILKKYQDDDLILSPNLRRRGTKTGFFGYGQLLPISNLKGLCIRQ